MKNLMPFLLLLCFVISCASSSTNFLKKEDFPSGVNWFEEKEKFDIPIASCYGIKLMPNMNNDYRCPSVGNGYEKEDGTSGRYDNTYYGETVRVIGTITSEFTEYTQNDTITKTSLQELYIIKAKDSYLFLKTTDLNKVKSIIQAKSEADKYHTNAQQEKDLIPSILEPYIKATKAKNDAFYNKITNSKYLKIMNRGYETWTFNDGILTLFEANYAFVVTFKSDKLASLYNKLCTKAGNSGSQYFEELLSQSMSFTKSVGKKVYETKIGLLKAVPTQKCEYLLIGIDDGKSIIFTAED